MIEHATQDSEQPSDAAAAQGPDEPTVAADQAPPQDAEGPENAAGDDNAGEPAASEAPAEAPNDAEASDADEQAGPEAAAPAAPAPLTPEELASVEAILFTADSPLSPGKIAEVAALSGGRQAALDATDRLNERYERMGCAFRIESRAAGFRMFTLPEHNDVLARLLKVRSDNKLSQAALETLSIVAYKQPVLRVDVEAIRGVSSGEMIRSLMEKSLVKIVGRAEEIGRPMLYGTTSKFLEVFGLNSLKDLPEVEASLLRSSQVGRAISPGQNAAETDGENAGVPNKRPAQPTKTAAANEQGDAPATQDACETPATPATAEASTTSETPATPDPVEAETPTEA